MPEPIRGIHHITAIASDPQRNLDFYTQVLGLRLVKLTVNFDDPGTYHFYFGDQVGHPGTILTFFPWTGIRRGRHGTGQVGVVAFRIPAGAAGYWADRLKRMGVTAASPFQRFDEEVITLMDPDGLQIELVAADWGRAGSQASSPTENGPVPAEYALQGFASPTLLLEGFQKTADLLAQKFGFTQVQQAGARYRFSSAREAGGQVDVEVRPSEPSGGMGGGVVHHIAFRARDDAEQLAYRDLLVSAGLDITPVLDRQYFHSIYFREPGGILFEIATDPPGFAIDEPVEGLGSQLKLPPWFETRRGTIEQLLPRLVLPGEQRNEAAKQPHRAEPELKEPKEPPISKGQGASERAPQERRGD